MSLEALLHPETPFCSVPPSHMCFLVHLFFLLLGAQGVIQMPCLGLSMVRLCFKVRGTRVILVLGKNIRVLVFSFLYKTPNGTKA